MRHPLFNFLLSLKRGTEELNYGREHIKYCMKKYKEQNLFNEYRVVDLGAGNGTDLLYAKNIFKNSAKIYALEYYEPYQKKLIQHGMEVFSIDLERDRLPFDDASIDTALSSYMEYKNIVGRLT